MSMGRVGGGPRGEQTCVQEAPGEQGPVVGCHDQDDHRAFAALSLVYSAGPSQLHIIQLCSLVRNLLVCTPQPTITYDRSLQTMVDLETYCDDANEHRWSPSPLKVWLIACT